MKIADQIKRMEDENAALRAENQRLNGILDGIARMISGGAKAKRVPAGGRSGKQSDDEKREKSALYMFNKNRKNRGLEEVTLDEYRRMKASGELKSRGGRKSGSDGGRSIGDELIEAAGGERAIRNRWTAENHARKARGLSEVSFEDYIKGMKEAG